MNNFDYYLPPTAIAQVPIDPRDAARLLVATDPAGAISHRRVADLPELLGPGDLLVVNETRVLPARLGLRKSSGGRAEVLLLEPLDDGDPATSVRWRALVRPGRRMRPETVLLAADMQTPVVRIGPRLAGGCREVELLDDPWRHGEVPLPPYITAALADAERYQTVYAARAASVAAPTAGLHFTEELLARCRAGGVSVAVVELVVGLDTFRPITADNPADHVMHSERYRVPAATLAAVKEAKRVVAVGTTTVRALEAAAATGQLEGRTSLFIRGEYPFALVDVLLTNFHLPRSSLLLLLDSFCGPRWHDLYAAALENGYRFLSFGDAMIVSRRDSAAARR